MVLGVYLSHKALEPTKDDRRQNDRIEIATCCQSESFWMTASECRVVDCESSTLDHRLWVIGRDGQLGFAN